MLNRLLWRLARWINQRRLQRLAGPQLSVGTGVQLYGFPILALHREGRLVIGDRVVLCSSSLHTALALNHPVKLSTLNAGATISLGAGMGMSGGTIVAAQRVTIGRDVLIGANVTIVDTDFHPVGAVGRRHSDEASRIGVAPVDIGDNVFIGAGSVVLKGVRIGRDSVVGAGSVVHGSFPERVVIAGNPAKVIGQVPD